LRALAISSATRHRLLPDVPTFAEPGYPAIEEYTWVGFFAPAGAPPEVVQKLNEAINRVLQMPDVRERLEALTFEPIGVPRNSLPSTFGRRSPNGPSSSSRPGRSWNEPRLGGRCPQGWALFFGLTPRRGRRTVVRAR